MICAAATGFCDSVVARAVARVEAKDERASGLPAARHQQFLSMPAYPRLTCAVHPAMLQKLPTTYSTYQRSHGDVRECPQADSRAWVATSESKSLCLPDAYACATALTWALAVSCVVADEKAFAVAWALPLLRADATALALALAAALAAENDEADTTNSSASKDSQDRCDLFIASGLQLHPHARRLIAELHAKKGTRRACRHLGEAGWQRAEGEVRVPG